jgi:CRP-like cAMP-binding protein
MHKNIDKTAVLRETGLFRNLTDSVLRTIGGCAIIRHLKRGEVLYSEHEEASGLYVVGRGELRSIRQGIDGREQVLSTERAGAILAAVAVFNGGKFYSTMIADTDSEVLCIGKRYMYELCQRHTELLWNLAAILAHKVRHSADLIETLALRNVEQRVAQHLFTTCQERGVRDGRACVIELTMSRTEIASRLGSAREVVSRAFTHLEKSGLIQMQGRRLVTIPDMRALRSFAGSDPPLEKARSVSELSSDIA